MRLRDPETRLNDNRELELEEVVIAMPSAPGETPSRRRIHCHSRRRIHSSPMKPSNKTTPTALGVPCCTCGAK